MAGEPDDQNYSTLQVRPETQHVASGIEAISPGTTATLPSRSSPSGRSIIKLLPEPPSPEVQRADSGLVVSSPPHIVQSHVIASPSSLTSSEPFAQWAPKGKISELSESRVRQRTICGVRPRYFWIALIASIVVFAAVIGAAIGVTVSKSKKHSSTQVPSSPPLGTANDTSTRLSSQTGLASVAWNDTKGVTQHRIYYQDGANHIRESTWDVITLTWVQTPEPIGQAKPDTPIAAAVAGSSSFSFQINVYALDDQDRLFQWFTRDGKGWTVGPITGTKVAADSSKLAAAWHGHEGCLGCSNNFLLVYQGNNGKFQLGNATIGVSWQWSELQAAPLMGSGISMSLFWWPNATAGVRLFYQTEDLHMYSLDWDAANSNQSNATDLWLLKEDKPLAMMPSNAAIASFAWSSAASGVPRILDTLSSGLGGITVHTWAGYKNAWVKSVSPPPMLGVRGNSSIAANANALVYAVMNDTIWEFGLKPDNRHWLEAGKVWP